MNDPIPDLGLEVPVSLEKPPTAWVGGEHSGERLTAAQRAEIRAQWAAGKSKSKIATELKHSRNTVAAVIDEDGDIGEHLRQTRATRMLVEEEDLRRMRSEVLGDLEEKGKLKPGDLTNAMMVASIAAKDAGVAAPQRVEIAVEHDFSAAAALMNGGEARQPLAFAPIPKTIEAETVLVSDQAPVPVEEKKEAF
jgi:hypothetical protein